MKDPARQVLLPGLLIVLLATFCFHGALAEQSERVGHLEVVSLTEGAEVFVDGEQVGVVPLPEKLAVSVGEHSIKVTKRGFTQHQEIVAIKLRQTTTVEADLIALKGIVRVACDIDEARVFIDDEYAGDAPLEIEVDPGEKTIRVTHAGYHDFEQGLSVVAGEEMGVLAELERLPPEEDPTVPAPPREKRLIERWWFWTLIGVGVVSVAVTVPVLATREWDTCAKYSDTDCDDYITVTVR